MRLSPRLVIGALIVGLVVSITLNVTENQKRRKLERLREQEVAFVRDGLRQTLKIVPEDGLTFWDGGFLRTQVTEFEIQIGGFSSWGDDAWGASGAGHTMGMHGGIDASKLPPLTGRRPDDMVDANLGEGPATDERILRRIMRQILRQRDDWLLFGFGLRTDDAAVGYITHPAGILVLMVHSDSKVPNRHIFQSVNYGGACPIRSGGVMSSNLFPPRKAEFFKPR